MVKLFVEGGGDYKSLRTECRKGFTLFFEKAGLRGHMPRVVASGTRRKVYDDFCAAIHNNELAMMLVDSEDMVEGNDYQPWSFLSGRKADQWTKPHGSFDSQCHLLDDFFGAGFNADELPKGVNSIEQISKERIFDCLKKATQNCKTKKPYGKGAHSFKILALLNPQKIKAASGWAKRLIDELKNI